MTTTPSALSKSTILQKVWQNVFDRLEDNVTSVTITGSLGVTIQTYTNQFPDKNIDEKSDYPILVVNSPTISWNRFTFRKKEVSGEITIDIYTTQKESADKFLDAIIDSIETYEDDLKGVGIERMELTGTNYDNATRGKIKVQLASCTFGFKYIFTETQR
jgi:hypothetical protein